MLVVSLGGKCWFNVESKAFEVSIEETKGKTCNVLKDGRRYLLELLTNKVKQYLFCLWDVEGKRFSLVFHEERGFVAVENPIQQEPKATSRKVLVPSGSDDWNKGSIAKAM
ncbi:hypothetical protein AAG906_016643 [Vitis piasezkii]